MKGQIKLVPYLLNTKWAYLIKSKNTGLAGTKTFDPIGEDAV